MDIRSSHSRSQLYRQSAYADLGSVEICVQRVQHAIQQESNAENLGALALSAWEHEMSVIEDTIDVLKAEQDMETLRDHALAITKAERGSTRKGMAMWLMVQQGAVVNQAGGQDEDGHQDIPLEHALRALDVPLVRFLIKAGADVNQPDPAFGTPLLSRVVNCSCEDHAKVVKTVQILIEAGADVNKADTRDDSDTAGCTPLCCASIAGNVEVVRALVEAGADVNRGNNNGYTPLGIAAERDMVEVVQILIAAGADFDYYSSKRPNLVKTVQMLIDAGADVNKADTADDNMAAPRKRAPKKIAVTDLAHASGTDFLVK